jgi:hypothetical protein
LFSITQQGSRGNCIDSFYSSFSIAPSVICYGSFSIAPLLQIASAFEEVCNKIERACTEAAALQGVEDIVALRHLSQVLSDFFVKKFRQAGGACLIFESHSNLHGGHEGLTVDKY